MNRAQKNKRIIASIFLLIFFPTVLPVNLLYASNNGPGDFDVAAFEPVDATDMVNLATGDMSYVLPLLNVPSPEGGYPLALSYHAGIAMDQESSWVGLGWSLNPGAINRNVNGYADDIELGKERRFSFDQGDELNYYTVGVGAGNKGISVGVGASWGSNKTFGGSVSFGHGAAAVSLSMSGDGVGVGVGYNGGVENLTSMKALGASIASKNGGGGMSSSGTGMSFSQNSSYNSSDYNIDVSQNGFNINYYLFSAYFGHSRVKYSLFKEDYKEYTGTLYPLGVQSGSDSDAINKANSESRVADTDKLLMYNSNTSLFDVIDDTKNYKGDNQLLPNLDHYQVNAQGLNGSMTTAFLEEVPLRHENIVLGYNHDSDSNSEIAYYNDYDYLSEYAPIAMFSNLDQTLRLNNKFFFEFENTNTSFLRINRGDIARDLTSEGNVNFSYDRAEAYAFAKTATSSAYNETTANGIALKAGNRKRTGKYIETFTNQQILAGSSQTGGWFLEAGNLNRNQPATYNANSIGAFRITDTDGKVYHYSLPVINFETWYKNFTDTTNEDNHFVESELMQPYATDWLLTAVTGPDYVDVNGNGKADTGDYGYWVEFDYGKWSDGYIWNTSSGNYDVAKEGVNRDDTYEYYRGRKQIYYLDAVRTRTHTAYFVKSLRNDSLGQELDVYNTPITSGVFNNLTNSKILTPGGREYFSNKRSNSYVDSSKYIGMPDTYAGQSIWRYSGSKQFLKYYDFPRHYSLKLEKIILVKNSTLIINKAAGTSLRSDKKAYLYENSAFKLNTVSYGQGGSDINQTYYNDSNTAVKTIDIHLSENVIDVNDIASLNVNQNAEKVINFSYNYNMMNYSPHSVASQAEGLQGKLTLNKVDILGKQGVSYMPGYKFGYNTAEAFDVQKEDGWGYHKDNPTAWNLQTITTPTGAKLWFEYEQDDYSAIAAKASKIFDKGLRFNITKNTSTNELLFTVYNNTEINDNIYSNFTEIGNYFTVGQNMALDMFICRRSKYGGDKRSVELDLNGVTSKVVAVDANSITFTIPDSEDYWTTDDQDAGWLLDRTFSYTSVKHTNGNSDGVIMREQELRNCEPFRDWPFNAYENDDVVVQYRLASSNLPNVDKGGGVRVKSIVVSNSAGSNEEYRYNYYYNKPGFGKKQTDANYMSSGATSFAPSKDILIIPYASELPPPVVIYGNVSIEQADYTGAVLQKTVYEFETYSPFQENASIYALGDYLTINNQQDITLTDDAFGNDSDPTNVRFSKYQIKSKINNLGRLLSVKAYNANDHLLSSTVNNYFVPQDAQGEIGTKQETYLSKNKSYDPGGTAESRYNVNSISKVWYPNILVSTATRSESYINTVYYDKYDFLTGNILEQRTESSTGKSHKIKSVPAYGKYAAMGAKVDNAANRNMLDQTAIDYSYILDNSTSTWKETGVGITTWSNIWTYRSSTDGTTVTPAAEKEKIWRMHKSYTWNGVTDSNGIFQDYNSATDDGFDWTIGVGSQPAKWKQLSEVTLYDRFSNLLEGKDISGNYSAIKTCDGDTKVSATGNAQYTEMYYSGFEYLSGSYSNPEVKITSASRITTPAFVHTGKYAIATSGSSSFGITLPVSKHRSGMYKLSVWVHKNNIASARLRIGTVEDTMVSSYITEFSGESYAAGDWVLKTHYINAPGDVFATTVSLYSDLGTVIYDDFRLYPVNTSMTSYVYNEFNEITHILGSNNLATRFEYDAGGRLIKTYQEIIDDTTNNITGGFKLRSKNEYNNYLNQ